MMSAMQVDLTNCDREPIHTCGAIQPHGILIVLDSADLRIVQVSDNSASLFGIGPSDLLGRVVDEPIGSANAESIRAAAALSDIREVNPIPMSVQTLKGPTQADAFVHRSGGKIVLELEPQSATTPAPMQAFHRIVSGSIDAFASVRNVAQLCAAAVVEVAELTKFDRVMIYRFDEDWNGEVVAEKHVAGMEPFLGLHYPASDIPQQAREIFRRNWLRLIPNTNYVPATIVPNSTQSGEPLDLSESVLRSVSPVHIEYLQNMGVGATMTITLLRNGQLWGLIACHHRTPKLMACQLRLACEILGRSMSLHLGTLEESDDTTYRMKLKGGQMRLLEAMSKSTDTWSVLATAEPDLLSLVGSDGAAICFGDDCRLVGRTPGVSEVLTITEWLAQNTSEELFTTNSLPGLEPKFEPLANTACGMIALALSRSKRSYVLWFRPEIARTVDWAGNPTKQLGTDAQSGRLTPRKSFELWTEVVRLHSRPWTSYEIDAAREWSHFVGTLIVDRAEQLERANRELAVANVELASLLRSNIELDSFAHIASHDLREPLRGINNYSTFLIEDYGEVVGEDGREKLETLVRLSRRMEKLIESLLALSSIGRGDFVGRPVELQSVVDDVLETYQARLAQCGGTISVVSALPLVYVDSARLGQVFSNLCANAIKYTDRPPRIEIGIDPIRKPPPSVAEQSSALLVPGAFTTVFVRDNGIGIREKHLATIFQMFKRLHPADAYGGGTGAGLPIAKKIVERHGGNMWAESTLGTGSTLYFTLPIERQCNVES
jgi:light-regulated signal transduction histidine kinase (bacteriophytochrome)